MSAGIPNGIGGLPERRRVPPPSKAVRDTFEFADRVYLCDYCGSMEMQRDRCTECGWDLLTWAGFLGRDDRFRVGSGELPKGWQTFD